MEIQALRLLITAKDLSDLASRLTAEVAQLESIKNLTLEPTALGVRIKGVYQTLMAVKFDSLWELSAQGSRVAARLAEFKVSGLGGAFLKTAFLNVLATAARSEDALQVQGENLTLDLQRLLGKQGAQVKLNLTAIRCEKGHVLIEVI